MPRKANDGRGRLGGRAKGTPNKPPKSINERVINLIDKNWNKFEEELSNLRPHERVTIMAQLIQSALK